MSSVTLTSSSKGTFFCDKFFDGGRVFTQLLSKSLYALSLLVLSAATYIFNKNFSLMCFSMAERKFSQGLNVTAFYFEFGEYLSDVSYNGCLIPPELPSEESGFKTALESHYGIAAVNHWWGLIPGRPINLEHRTELLKKGVCFGMSLDFLAEYAWRVQEGLEPILAIREVSARYADGAPKEAQLAQIFSEISLPSTKECCEYIQQMGKEDQNVEQLHSGSTFGDLQAYVFSKVEAMENRVYADSLQAAGKKLGLRLELPVIYNCPKTSMGYEESLSHFLDSLPAGPYLMAIDSLKSCHAASLIKSSDGQYFFFDPNVGTTVWRKGEFSARFCQLLKCSGLEGRLCSLSLWPATCDPVIRPN